MISVTVSALLCVLYVQCTWAVECNPASVPPVPGWSVECGCIKGYNDVYEQANSLAECTQKCMTLGDPCRSVEWRPSDGSCVISSEDKHTQPQDYRTPCINDEIVGHPTYYSEPTEDTTTTTSTSSTSTGTTTTGSTTTTTMTTTSTSGTPAPPTCTGWLVEYGCMRNVSSQETATAFDVCECATHCANHVGALCRSITFVPSERFCVLNYYDKSMKPDNYEQPCSLDEPGYIHLYADRNLA